MSKRPPDKRKEQPRKKRKKREPRGKRKKPRKNEEKSLKEEINDGLKQFSPLKIVIIFMVIGFILGVIVSPSGGGDTNEGQTFDITQQEVDQYHDLQSVIEDSEEFDNVSELTSYIDSLEGSVEITPRAVLSYNQGNHVLVVDPGNVDSIRIKNTTWDDIQAGKQLDIRETDLKRGETFNVIGVVNDKETVLVQYEVPEEGVLD